MMIEICLKVVLFFEINGIKILILMFLGEYDFLLLVLYFLEVILMWRFRVVLCGVSCILD